MDDGTERVRKGTFGVTSETLCVTGDVEDGDWVVPRRGTQDRTIRRRGRRSLDTHTLRRKYSQ